MSKDRKQIILQSLAKLLEERDATKVTTAVLAAGTVYSVVKSVVVKSAFLFIKLFAIMIKRSLPLLPLVLILLETLYLIFPLQHQDL